MSGHTYTHTHIHTHIHTYTHNNYYNPRCAHAHRGLIKNTREGLFLSDAQGNNFNNTISMCNKYGQISSYFTINNTFTNTMEIRNGGIGIFERSQIININSGIKRSF